MLSGVLRTNAYEGSRYYELRWSATQSIPSNTSSVSWELYAIGSVNYAERTVNVRIDGATVFSKVDRVMRSQGLVASGTSQIGHWSDGSRYFLAEIEAAVYTSSITVSASSNFTLDTIPRSSYMSYMNGYTIGTKIILDVYRYDASFTCQFWFRLGNSGWYDCEAGWGTTQSGNTIKIDFTIPNDWCRYIPNSPQGTLEMCLRTHDRYGNHIGSDEYKSVTVYVNRDTVYPSIIDNASSKPTISVYNANTKLDELNLCVAGYSRYKISASCEGALGSVPSIFKIEEDGKTNSYPTVYSVQDQGYRVDFTSDIMYSDRAVTLYVMDTRGIHSFPKRFEPIKVQKYYKPSISTFNVQRSTKSTRITTTSVTALVKFDHSPLMKNGKDVNTTTATLSYKKPTEENWHLAGSLENEVPTEIHNLEDTSSYEFRVVVRDILLNTASSETTVSTKNVLMNFSGSHTGLAIGKVSEHPDSFEIDLDTRIYSPIYLQDIGKTPIPQTSAVYGMNDFRGCYFEYIEGTNYSCFKYANGVMRITQSVNFTGYFNTQYGSVWTATANLGNFAVPFIDTPKLESVINTSGITFWLDSMDGNNPMTATKIGSMYFSRTSSVNSKLCSVNVTAVGHWR